MPLHATQLFLSSLAIGIIAATVVLEGILLLNFDGTGKVLADLGPIVLTLIWAHLTMMLAPFATLILLMAKADD